MVEYPFPDHEDEAAVVELLSGQMLTQEICAPARSKSVQGGIAASTLFRMASSTMPIDVAIMDEVNRRPSLREFFFKITKQFSIYHFGEAIAASSGPIQRVASGCRIRTESSLAEKKQIYLIIEFDQVSSKVSQLILFDEERQSTSIELPSGYGSICQLLLDEDDAVLSLLAKPSTVIFLK